MNPIPGRERTIWIPLTFWVGVFVFLSIVLLPYPGLQEDELLFSAPIYLHQSLFSVRFFGRHLPVMLMGYLGTVKTWLYFVIFHVVPPNLWSVRVPVVLLGALTIWLTWVWTRRVVGERAAAFSIAILATDAMFILTNTFDWGPVALQHVLLMGGLVAIQNWMANGDRRWLIFGMFLWGLGLWDKALMVWPLTGLTIATLCVYPKELWSRLERRTLLIGLASLLVGAFPLIIYNVAWHGDTVSFGKSFSLRVVPDKFAELKETLGGTVLMGSIVAETPGPVAQSPSNLLERISLWIRRFDRNPGNLMLPAMLLSLAGLWFRRRLLIWILIMLSVTWLEMASNTGTGGSAHHVILLWPFPCVFVGISLAGIADRMPRWGAFLAKAVVALIVCANLLNTNEYLVAFIQNGSERFWSDAIYRLPEVVSRYQNQPIGIVDWGYANSLQLAYEGKLHLFYADDEDSRSRALTLSNVEFIQHTNDFQALSHANDAMRSAALGSGYTESVDQIVQDYEDRPVYEIFHLVKTASSE
jgi:hypothetical protein